jgi:CheY-like chemotaxis protein
MNLCTNAAHAMEPHGGTLEINLKNIELTEDQCRSKFNTAPGAYVLLKVSDTGKGMSSDILERIFEPYFTTKAPGDGTGLGLSVVHGIVNNLHGLINVSSQVNQGTTFEIYLPRISEPVEPEIKKINKLPRGRENILVDDEAVILEIMREMLQALGYQVYVAESGWKALESLQSNPQHIDLIVTDQVMPKMTGIQLIEAVHRLRPDLPIILCTGMQMKNKENSGINSKINKVLYKPIDYDQLAVAIREALDTKR